MSGGRRASRGPAETVADYDVRPPAVRTILTVVGTLVFVGALAALLLGVSILMRETRVATSQVDVGANGQLVIEATDTDIEIVEGEPDLLTVTSRITSGVRQTDYQLGRRGDSIRIATACQKWLNPGCGVKTRLQVPPGLPLEIRTTTGDVKVTAMSQGVLTVRTVDGRITADDLGVDELTADSDTGAVKATFASQPFAFKATTGSGAIDATIPTGSRTYTVDASSKSGQVDSEIESQDGSTDGGGDAGDEGNFIRVESTSGDIRLRNGPAVEEP